MLAATSPAVRIASHPDLVWWFLAQIGEAKLASHLGDAAATVAAGDLDPTGAEAASVFGG